MTTSFIIQNNTTEAKPATGRHAEALGDLEQMTLTLLQLIACERSGVYDGFGQSFWLNEDALLTAARKIVEKVEWRVPLIPRIG